VVEQNGAYSAKSTLAGMLDVGGDDGKEEATARGAIETREACGRAERRIQHQKHAGRHARCWW